jgi:hypothetical protein
VRVVHASGRRIRAASEGRRPAAREEAECMSDVVLSRSTLVVLLAIVLLCAAAFIGSLAIIYFGDEFMSPSLNEASVPAPRSY